MENTTTPTIKYTTTVGETTTASTATRVDIPVELPTDTQISFNPQQLLTALYWVWDAFDRANVVMFLVNHTAEDALNNLEPGGISIDVGVRREEWVSGGRRLLDAFLGDPIIEDEKHAEYLHEGVRVNIFNYEKNPCTDQPDSINYMYETFRIPNPYKEFKEKYA